MITEWVVFKKQGIKAIGVLPVALSDKIKGKTIEVVHGDLEMACKRAKEIEQSMLLSKA